MDRAAIRKKLTTWYRRAQRDLPWRRTRDPYAIWISEIMLQQTRVAAAIPYYERFLARFPTVQALAQASENEVLALWSGLGYYSRARNLHKAARQIVERGGFPQTHDEIRTLAGVGDYTAAAIASIAFGLPHAAVDGNVRRVLMRWTADASIDVARTAQGFLDARHPGQWNQAMMELGATLCVPGEPKCLLCPVHQECRGFQTGAARSLPPPKARPQTTRKHRTLIIVRNRGRILLTPGTRVSGFWELPETHHFPPGSLKRLKVVGTFRHAITSSQYLFEVLEGAVQRAPAECTWWAEKKLAEVLLSTAAKKALRCC